MTTGKQNPKVEWGYYAMTPRIVRTQYKQLSHTEKWLYVCLKDLCGDRGTCYRTLKVLSQETDLSTGNLSTGIRNLHAAGLIHAEKKRRSNNPTAKEVWHITIVDIWQANVEECSNFERPDDNVQNLNDNVQELNHNVQNMNEPSPERSKFEAKRSNFVDRSNNTEEEHSEERTIEEDSCDSATATPPSLSDDFAEDDEPTERLKAVKPAPLHCAFCAEEAELVCQDCKKHVCYVEHGRVFPYRQNGKDMREVYCVFCVEKRNKAALKKGQIDENTPQPLHPANSADVGHDNDAGAHQSARPGPSSHRDTHSLQHTHGSSAMGGRGIESENGSHLSTSDVDNSQGVGDTSVQQQMLIAPVSSKQSARREKWNEQAMVAKAEELRGKAYSEMTRPKEINAAKKIFKRHPESTLEEFERVFAHRNDDWWHEHCGLLNVTDLAATPKDKNDMRYMLELDKMEREATKSTLKIVPASKVQSAPQIKLPPPMPSREELLREVY
jgi:DNA-binding transcriptional regulator GbsR (MarR family)